MQVKFTARHFKPQDSLREYAHDAVSKLERYYDGIVRSEIIVNQEHAGDSLKVAEVHLTVYGTLLKAIGKHPEYAKAVDAAIEKLERQLVKYKSKLHKKGKGEVRKIIAKD